MAKCKLCKTNIPDGAEYCEECQDKGSMKADESYLDGLLNSVKNTVPTVESIYKKKSANSGSPETVSKKAPEIDPWDSDFYKVELSDIEDFDQLIHEDSYVGNDIEIQDEELFGEDITNLLYDNEAVKNDNSQTELTASDLESILQENDFDTANLSFDVEEATALASGSRDTEEFQRSQLDTVAADTYDITERQETIVENEAAKEEVEDNIDQDEIFKFEDDDNIDEDLNALLNNLDFAPVNSEIPPSNAGNQMPLEDGLEFARENELEHLEAEEDDFMSLLNQISSDDPVAEDMQAINDLLQGKPIMAESMPSDVGDVFSDALRVVSNLHDADEVGVSEKKKDKAEKDLKKAKSGKKSKKGKKSQKAKEENETDKPKRSFWQRLFGNVEEETTGKKTSAGASDAIEVIDEKLAKKKASKGKKGTVSKEEDDTSDNTKGKSVVDKKEAKKDKKEKKKKDKEIIKVIDEIDEDEGRINRLGAFIVFLFFGLLMLLLLVGTNAVSYTLSIQNATNYFEKQKYTEAYNEVYGIEIKDEDIEIYDKIMTVMYVNKQLNSYNNYYSIEKYPEALDSLLKGLKRYDKYIELATMLGIKTDLDYVRTQILAELNNEFHLSEKEALKLNDYESMEEYSLQVYDVVLERKNN